MSSSLTFEQAHKFITSHWVIRPEMRSTLTCKYYLLKWSKEYLISQIQTLDNNKFTLTHEGITYTIMDVPYKEMVSYNQVYISFRVPSYPWSQSIDPIALIRGVK